VSSIELFKLFGYVEIVLCVAAFCFIVLRKQWRDYWALGSFLAVRAASKLALATILHNMDHLSKATAYHRYFWIYWSAFAVQAILAIIILYGLFRNTTTPLKGLQRFGSSIFRGVASICVVLALGSAFAPHMNGPKYFVTAISQLQRAQSILTICLVLFVFSALRSMGLSYKSKVFGVSLGLGLMAVDDLVQSMWLAFNPRMYGTFNFVNGFVICAVLAIWAGYFATREPRRREVALEASSPFMRLDRMALGWFG
jgi:hypothetical protein